MLYSINIIINRCSCQGNFEASLSLSLSLSHLLTEFLLILVSFLVMLTENKTRLNAKRANIAPRGRRRTRCTMSLQQDENVRSSKLGLLL